MEVEEPDTGDGEPFIDFSRGEVTDMANVVCADRTRDNELAGPRMGRM